ncbi:hypothetical protein DID88_007278 [Monilinia fructigena]|uniref:Uncharacterized protein n=1 Tax=Monilinia fructigena TaxID=38457 RepID=A0A395JA81_9HELO|nr:hypothetical protein DID88_007278 [Monilinia fructigena]
MDGNLASVALVNNIVSFLPSSVLGFEIDECCFCRWISNLQYNTHLEGLIPLLVFMDGRNESSHFHFEVNRVGLVCTTGI